MSTDYYSQKKHGKTKRINGLPVGKIAEISSPIRVTVERPEGNSLITFSRL